MRLIAREAGTSESQLVRYFASKSGLLEAIFNEAWNALNEPIQAIISSAENERAAIARILRLIIDAFGRDHELGFIFLFEGRRIRGHEVALSKGFLTFYEMIHQLIRQGHRYREGVRCHHRCSRVKLFTTEDTESTERDTARHSRNQKGGPVIPSVARDLGGRGREA